MILFKVKLKKIYHYEHTFCSIYDTIGGSKFPSHVTSQSVSSMGDFLGDVMMTTDLVLLLFQDPAHLFLLPNQ